MEQSCGWCGRKTSSNKDEYCERCKAKIQAEIEGVKKESRRLAEEGQPNGGKKHSVYLPHVYSVVRSPKRYRE